MSSLRHIAVLLAALVALALPSAAWGSSGAVIRDCNDDGKLDKKYSKKELKKALKRLPSDIKEYSDCPDVIRAAIDAAGPASPGGGASSSGGPPTSGGTIPQDEAALEQATSGKEPPAVKVGRERIKPGSNGLFNLSTANNEIPLPLALALIAIGLLVLGATYWGLRRRFPALAGLSLRGRLPSLRRVPLPRFRR
jgi:hypothetical protein